MTKANKHRLHLALTTASELIRSSPEVGIEPDDVGEEDEAGLKEYVKATARAAKLIETLSNKYVTPIRSVNPD